MNPSTRTRLLNQWIQSHSQQDMTYPALHGFLCARLVGPETPDWQRPLAGLLEQDAELEAIIGKEKMDQLNAFREQRKQRMEQRMNNRPQGMHEGGNQQR